MQQFGIEVHVTADNRAQALATMLGAAAVLDQTGNDATWEVTELPREGVVTVPGGRDVWCQVTLDGEQLRLMIDAAELAESPRIPLWLDAVRRRLGLPAEIGPRTP